ncbi:hypothetical protein POL68_29865 [Stigmatella sp. ncwal1]|uniref:Outer membrane protein beta-barrel domain-containing protein n=1 Tax=Stigmatella ashevillensis TaxID=2995309 RepID=A0ABT5DGB7_9BACT|nr:hypothetical protein [Stigmatella ashevillena]MDC0712706.1 hypothetical protein [Stigmatella ashevillena]
MRSLSLALLFTASLTAQAQTAGPGPAAYTPPLRALVNELHAETGLLTGGYSFEGGGWNDVFLASGGGALYLFGGLTVEGSVLSLLPLERGGPGASISLAARVGYTGQRWSVVAGPVIQGAYPANPILQVLPSVRGLYDVGPVRLDAGLLDWNGMVPAHVGLSYGPVGLAYVLPLGVRAQARIPLTARAGLQVSGYAFRLFGAHSALLTVGLVGNPPSSRPGATP